jgi:hypothetical protein
LFQFRVRPCHGCSSSPDRIREKEPGEAAGMCGRFTLRRSPHTVAEAFRAYFTDDRDIGDPQTLWLPRLASTVTRPTPC